MSDTSSSGRLVGFVVGAVVGAAGLLMGQALFTGEERGRDVAGDEQAPPGIQAALDDSLAESQRLRKENKRMAAELAGASEAKPVAVAATEEEQADEKSGLGDKMMKAMMEFGAQAAKKKIDAEVAELALRLDLTEPQQEEIRAALLAKVEAQQEAGLLMMSGKAALEDLAAADEDNFAAVDAAMADILNDAQLAEYGVYAEEREVNRIERKANEELDGLQAVGLTEEQADQAWQVFADLNAADKPGEIPPGMTMADFEGYIDKAIQDRHNGLQPILTPEQMEIYGGETDKFRTAITDLIRGGTGG